MRKIALTLALAAPLALGGCAALNQIAAAAFQKPRLTFRSVALQTLDLEGATLGFTFDLENPNGFGVSLARGGYAVEVEGKRVVAGELASGLRVAANATSPVTFPVHVRFADVPGFLSLVQGREELRYRLSGTAGVETPVGVVDLPLSYDGRLGVPRLPGFAVEGVSVRGATFSDVALDVRLRVENPNGFPLPVGSLSYGLQIAGSPVAHADGRPISAIPPRGSAVVAIPVRVDLAGAGRAAAQLLQGGEVQVGLHGKASFAGVPVPLDLDARVPSRR